MCQNKKVEEKIIELYPSDLSQSPVHPSIGQEAVAVGFAQLYCLKIRFLLTIVDMRCT